VRRRLQQLDLAEIGPVSGSIADRIAICRVDPMAEDCTKENPENSNISPSGGCEEQGLFCSGNKNIAVSARQGDLYRAPNSSYFPIENRRLMKT
jgi:hypothetical protein